MNANEDGAKFRALLTGAMDFYGKEVSDFAANIWWSALRTYDIGAVISAFERHLGNPDTGQFPPKPADIVKALEGTTQDTACMAWAKVQQAVGSVGGYRSVVFDDPIIHLAIVDVGGWPELCECPMKELPFLQKRFENAYRAYRLRRDDLPPHSRHLPGRCERENALGSYPVEPPMLVGNQERARLVMQGGSAAPRLPIHMATAAEAATVKLQLVRKEAA